MKKLHITKNESGFVLVTSLFVLVILTLVGISGVTNTSVELQIAGNDRQIKEMFYDAEAAAIESSGYLEEENDPDELIATRTSKPWLLDTESDGTDPVRHDNRSATWEDPTYKGNLIAAFDNPGVTEVKLAAVDHGIVTGSAAESLKVAGTSVHGYRLFGYAKQNNSWKLIEIGYRKRF